LFEDGSLVLKPEADQVVRGREYVARTCAGFGDDFVGTAVLLTSELITHALLHGSRDITLLLSAISAGVRVEVAPVEVAAQPPAATADVVDAHGPGLLIVDSLATAWGFDPLPDRGATSAWFVLLAQA
jgi:hypothetical protein